MKHRNRIKRAAALSLAAALTVLGAIPAYGAEAPEKDEVIYVNLTPEGGEGTIYVVNSYDLTAETSITDYGSYRRVKNLTTTQELACSGDTVTFTAPAGRFYYQGELDPARIAGLPWRVSAVYLLDGKEIPGEELAGAAGHLEIRVSLRQNPEAAEVYRDNYALQTTLSLDSERCKNIVAEGATMADVGKLRQMSYIVLPGKEKDFTVTADVRDFEMDGIQVNGIPLVLDIEDPDTAEIKDQIYDLQDGAAQLDDGAIALEEGVDQLQEGVEDLRDGAEDLQSGALQLSTGAKQLNDAFQALSPIFDRAVDQYAGSLSPAEEARIKAVYRAFEQGIPTMAAASGLLAGGTDQLTNGVDSLYDGVLKLKDGVTELSDGTMQLRDQSADMDAQVDDKVDEMIDEYRSKSFDPVSFVSDKNDSVAVVQFVIKTGDIKVPDTSAAAAPEEEEEDGTLWQRVTSLFQRHSDR